jgi:hypothetical protein
MMLPSMSPLRFECEVFDFFQEFLSQDPINKNNSSSLILTNLELKFEACMLNLI